MDIWDKDEEGRRLALRFKGINRADFARRHGLNDSYIGQQIKGSRPISRPYAMAYVKEFGVPLAEISPRLAAETKGMVFGSSLEPLSGVRALHPDDALDDETISIPESTVTFSAGPGHNPTFEYADDEREPANYQLSWFQKERINPKRAKRFRVVGDSMEPFVFAGDSILVNLDETNIVDGKIYAIRYGDDLRVKILSKRLDGTLILRSYNPEYRDEEIPPALAEEHISIIGRVRDKSGTGGL